MHTAIRTIDPRALIHFGMITLIFFGIVLGYFFAIIPQASASVDCGCEWGARYRLTAASDVDDFTCPSQKTIIKDGWEAGGCSAVRTGNPSSFYMCQPDPSCSAPPPPPPPPPPACSDGSDNDGDGLTDMSDPGCGSPSDNDEWNAPPPPPPPPACSDGWDNDGDGDTDMSDPGCSWTGDNDEWNAPPPPPPAVGSIQVSTNNGSASWTIVGPTSLGGSGTYQWYSSQPTGNYTIIWNDVSGYTRPGNSSQTLTTGGTLSFSGSYSAIPPPPPPPPPSPSACSDGWDNDGDGLTDMSDPGCSSGGDTDEWNAPPATACNDGSDNDGDGLTDMSDPGCSSPSDNDEWSPPAPPPSACSDGWDNDGDGDTDMGDAGCTWSGDTDEWNPPPPSPSACSDGWDNDGDGLTDMSDPGCSSGGDTDEWNAPPPTACSDGWDNDGDGLTDMGDPGCGWTGDTDEWNAPVPPPATPVCSDGGDNDSDGLVDMSDPGCSNPSDTDEWNAPPPSPACSDGWDNDGDGLTDMGDPGCGWAGDPDEWDAPPPPTPACSDGSDNDGDGDTDYPDDPGCSGGGDTDEWNAPPPSGCSAGIVGGICSAPAGSQGQTIGNSSCATGYNGTCNITCNSGVWSINGNSCTAPSVTDFEVCDSTGTNCGSNITVNANDPITFTWTSSGATVCDGTLFPTSGNTNGTVNVNAVNAYNVSRTYTLTCYTGGAVVSPSQVADVTVTTNFQEPTLTIKQNATAVKTVELGSPVTIEWDSNNNNQEGRCRLTGGGLVGYSPLPSDGNETGSTAPLPIGGRTLFKIDCDGLLGEATVDVVPMGWES